MAAAAAESDAARATRLLCSPASAEPASAAAAIARQLTCLPSWPCAAFGALYSGSECVIEQTRAKHDIYNSAYAGCFTGGVMARSGGKEAMAMGCATMGALSVAMDRFMDIH